MKPIMPKTKRERNTIIRLGARRKPEMNFRVVTQRQFDTRFKHPSTLYKTDIDLECVNCCKRIKAHESFWLSWRYVGRFECLRCRPVAKY